MAQRKDSRKGRNEQVLNGETLLSAVRWIVDVGIFDKLKFHGNTGWRPADLVVLAVVWVWSDSSTLTGAFQEARRWSLKVLGRAALSTYQGLLGALVNSTGQMLPLLWGRMHELMEHHGGTHWRVGLWLALAVDGSRVSTPRSKANEQAFCAPNYGHSNTAKYRRRKRQRQGQRRRRKKQPQPVRPQVWLTLIWHLGMRMPWSWKSGPSHASERDHLRQMLREQTFPKNTLFCADAGFTGYDLWKAIIDRQHGILIRVGSNVTLLRKLGYYTRERAGIVYCWPDAAARKKLPPLVLRLLRFRLGRTDMCLVTNVLEPSRLSDKQAMQLYRLRWGVELQFRTLKQTFGRRKLRSKRPDRALVELDWSLLGLTMIQLFAFKEQIEFGTPPERSSASLAIRIVRETIHRWAEIPNRDDTFALRLQAAVIDDYQRHTSKKARYRPNYKDKPAAGQPNVINANREHRKWLATQLASAA